MFSLVWLCLLEVWLLSRAVSAANVSVVVDDQLPLSTYAAMAEIANAIYVFRSPADDTDWNLEVEMRKESALKITEKTYVGIYRKGDQCVVSFAGSNDWGDWQNNFQGFTTISSAECGMFDVHFGFHNAFRSILLQPEWNNKFAPYLYANCSGGVSSVGHSLGGAIASQFAACANFVNGSEVTLPNISVDGFLQDGVYSGGLVKLPMRVSALYTFGAPSVSMVQLNNSLVADGVFAGARFYNEDFSRYDPVPAVATAFGYVHPRVKAVRLVAAGFQEHNYWNDYTNKNWNDYTNIEYEATSTEAMREPRTLKIGDPSLHMKAPKPYCTRIRIVYPGPNATHFNKPIEKAWRDQIRAMAYLVIVAFLCFVACWLCCKYDKPCDFIALFCSWLSCLCCLDYWAKQSASTPEPHSEVDTEMTAAAAAV